MLEYTAGVGTLPENEPRNRLWEASPVLTAGITSELNSALRSLGMTAFLQMELCQGPGSGPGV